MAADARGGPRRPPIERVRERLRASEGEAVAAAVPRGYQRLGRVLLLRLPGTLRPHFAAIGRAWQAELGVEAVLSQVGPVSGELREPAVERIAGGSTETEVREHGARWRFDAARLMFAAGNRFERRRAAELVGPGEHVVDLFAGIGYFSIPIARAVPSARVLAVEKNPVAFRYLTENVARNGVAERVACVLGDNRRAALPAAAADRVFLGYLPDATPWLDRAIQLLRPAGGWVHVHTVVDARGAIDSAIARVAAATADLGAALPRRPVARAVKPYGPGRTHVVVDARLAPA
ncbi:MAG TPA: methyltransferase domain-containing protein [Thermoplasmata archaeon]|nr:methyltransferase domain-containing protein [Thermoplasmata archaeon]